MKNAYQTVFADGAAQNGTVRAGKNVTLAITLPRSAGVVGGALRFQRDGESVRAIPLSWRGAFPPLAGGCDGEDFLPAAEQRRALETWSADVGPLPAGLYFYEYELTYGTKGRRAILGGDRVLTQGATCRLTAYPPPPPSSSVLGGKTIYHVFVDRFRRSGRCEVRRGARFESDWDAGEVEYAVEKGGELKNDVFFGGDLWGVAEKLDHICSLGADYIYLSPVFTAASNHKYDVGDYLSVDPAFGGDGALRALIAAAKARGVGVILDGVFDHTGDDSAYFNKYGSFPGTGAYQSPSSEYFGWYDFRRYPDEYASWWNVPILPKINTAEPSFRRFICERVVPKWSALGVAGWRLDVADELSDVFLDDFRAALGRCDPRAFIIGEVWDDASDKCAYGKRRRYFSSGQLDSVMNYPLRDAAIAYVLNGDSDRLRRTLDGLLWRYPPHNANSLMNFLGTHDTPRILTVLGDSLPESSPNADLSADRLAPQARERALRLTAIAFTLICAAPGALSIYYGDEAGMEGHGDPFCRRPYPWGREDRGLLAHLRRLGGIRRAHRAFADGDLRILALDRRTALIARRAPGDFVLCAVNRSEDPCRLAASSEFTDLFTGRKERSFILPGECSAIYSLPDADATLKLAPL